CPIPRKVWRRELPSRAIVSVSSELLPDPDTPTTIETAPLGKLTSTSRRLLALAPTTSMESASTRAMMARHGGEGHGFAALRNGGGTPGSGPYRHRDSGARERWKRTTRRLVRVRSARTRPWLNL